eukprot:tig00000789_g4140.t1
MERPALFRTEDPVTNLVLRVTLRRVRAAAGVQLSYQATGASAAGADIESDDLGDANEIVTTLRWQQKVFSPREVAHYSTLANPRTPLEQRYADEVKSLVASSDDGPPVNLVFTYVDVDEYVDRAELERAATTSSGETLTPLAREVLSARMRRRRGGAASAVAAGAVTVDGHLPISDAKCQRMAIMACLDMTKRQEDKITSKSRRRKEQANKEKKAKDEKAQEVGGSESKTGEDAEADAAAAAAAEQQAKEEQRGLDPQSGFEKVLCYLKYYSTGTLEMRPGFCVSEGDSYHFTTPRGVQYEFIVQNLSDIPDDDERTRRDTAAENLRAVELRQAVVGTEFIAPPGGLTSRVTVFGQVAAARGFTAQDLYFEYVVDVPPGWQSEGGSLLQAVSHCCTVSDPWYRKYHPPAFRVVEEDDQISSWEPIAHFCYPLELEFLCNNDDESPMIYFQVNSYDDWDRNCVHGYGYLSLPTTPGRHELTVQMWRPAGTLRSKRAEFFLGGSASLSSPSAVAKGATQGQGGVSSKLGFKTEAAGALTVSLHVAIQKAEHAVVRAAAAPAMLSRGGPLRPRDTGPKSIAEILQRARERLAALVSRAVFPEDGCGRETSAGDKANKAMAALAAAPTAILPAPATPTPSIPPGEGRYSQILGQRGLLRVVAATAIQSTIRSWRARKAHKDIADRQLQRLALAATVVQTLWRRLISARERKQLYDAREEIRRAAAALRIGAAVRMHQARQLRKAIKRRKAALKICAVMRRRLARRKRKLFRQRAKERETKKLTLQKARLVQAVTRRWLARKWLLFCKSENGRLTNFCYEASDHHVEVMQELHDKHSDNLHAEADRHADELRRVAHASERAVASRRHLEAVQAEMERHARAAAAEIERYREAVQAAEQRYMEATSETPKYALGGKGFGRWRVHSQEDVEQAAKMLQAYCRGLMLRVAFLRYRGAKLMQCAGRRFLARRRRALLVRYKKNAAVFDSAIYIQAAFRMWRLRHPFARYRRERRARAALVVQIWWRYTCKRSLLQHGLALRMQRMRNRAAVCIQCFYRARNQRTSTWLLVIQEGIKRQREVVKRNATIKIQAAVRRRKARRIYAGMLRAREAEIAKMMADLIGSQVESVKEVTLEHIWLEHQQPSKDEAIFGAVEDLWAVNRFSEGLAVLEEAHHRLAAVAHVDEQARQEGREVSRALVLTYAALIHRLVNDDLPQKAVEHLLTVVSREEPWPLNTAAGRIARKAIDLTRSGADLPDRLDLRTVAMDAAASFLLSRGQAARALEYATKAIRCCVPGANPRGPTTLSSTVLLIRAAAIASRVGRHQESQELLAQAIDSFTPEAQTRSLRTAIDFRAQAHWSQATGALALSYDLSEPPAGSANKWLLAVCHQNCAVELIALGQNRKAQQVCQDAVRLVSNMPTSHPWLMAVHKTHLVARHNIFADLHDDDPPPRSPKPAPSPRVNWDGPAGLMPKFPPPRSRPAASVGASSSGALAVPSDPRERRPSILMKLALASAPSSHMMSFQYKRPPAPTPQQTAQQHAFILQHLQAMQEGSSGPPGQGGLKGSFKGGQSAPASAVLASAVLQHGPNSVGGWAGQSGGTLPSASLQPQGPGLRASSSARVPRASPAKAAPVLHRPKSSPYL